MKNLMCYLFIKKTICLFSSIAAIIVVLTITYSCTKDNKAYNNEQQTVPEARASEKQFIVFDESGNNSVTLRVSSDDGTLLVNHNAESYELIINPEIPKEKTNCDSCNVVEDADFVDFNDRIKVTSVTIQLDIINVSFKDKVNNYALVSHGSSIVGEDEEEMEEEEMEAKFDFCRWFPLRS